MLPRIEITGHVESVSLRITGQGKPVCNFTVHTLRLQKRGEEWQEKDHTRLRCVCWDRLAERVSDAVAEGTEVTVVGDLKQLARDQGFEVTAKHVSLALPEKSERVRPVEDPEDPWTTTPPADPWATDTEKPA